MYHLSPVKGLLNYWCYNYTDDKTSTHSYTAAISSTNIFGPGGSGFVNNKGADQPALPCRLIRAFVVRLLESIISKLVWREL